MKTLSTLKARITIALIGVVIISISLITIFTISVIKKEIREEFQANANNLLNATLYHVESLHSSILYHEKVMLSRRKIELKNNVTLAKAVVTTSYERYRKGELLLSKAKTIALEDLTNLRYDNGVGYFWINDTTITYPTILTHPFMPELIGKPMDDSIYFHGLGPIKNIGEAFATACQKNEEGFIDYLWPKPISNGRTELRQKISYVNLFKPWNWIIGSGVYIDDIQKDVKNRIEAVIDDLNKMVTKQIIGRSGYFFVFNKDLQMLAHPNISRKYVGDFINPSTGKLLFEDMMKAADTKAPFSYLWDKPGNEGQFTFEKEAFVTYYEPLKWYIGSSVYKEDLDFIINKTITNVLLFSFSLIIFAFLTAWFLTKNITRPLNRLIKSIGRTNKEGIPTDNLPHTNIPEILLLSKTINKMILSIERSKLALKKERDYSLDIINNSPVLICGIGPDGKTRFVNPSSKTITGFSPEELISNNWWDTIFPEKFNTQVKELHKQLDSENIRDHEMTILTKSNSERIINWSFIKQQDSNKEWLLGFGNDITEIINAKKKIMQANQELEQKVLERTSELTNLNRELKDFAHIISHDLKAPLRGINRVAKWLKEDYSEKLNPSGINQLDLLYKSSKNLDKLINGVLEYSKTMKSELKIETINLNKLIQEVIETLLPEAHISINIPNELPSISGDRIKLQQIFLNLLSNAIKYSNKSDVQIFIESQNNDLNWQISIKDNGLGIKEKYFQKIFDLFQTAGTSSKQNTGIGLAVVKKIIEQHQGKIWVESTENIGSTFYFTISRSLNENTYNY